MCYVIDKNDYIRGVKYLRKMRNKSITIVLVVLAMGLVSCKQVKNFYNDTFKSNDTKKSADFFTLIDNYPVFDVCSTLTDEEQIKACFETTIIEHIQRDLDTLNIPEGIQVNNVAVFIYVDVLKDGSCTVHEIQDIEKVEGDLPSLSALIRESVYNLPNVTPAKKKNNFVSSRFLIPLTIEGL